MKILASILVLTFAFAAGLTAQESAPKRKTPPPPVERIVEGALIWTRGSTAVAKIPRETIEATLADSALTVKAGNKTIPLKDLPAGTKVFIKLREEFPKFTILELGQDRSDVTPVAPPQAAK